ncbi:MAG: hypothetical protein AAFR81_19345 [Chloroflexota bacterium]
MTNYTPKKKKNSTLYQRVSPTNFVLLATLARVVAYIVLAVINPMIVSAMPIQDTFIS